MKLLKNPEIKRNFILWLIVGAAAVTAAFIVDVKCGVTNAALFAVLTVVHYASTYKRYKRIADLSLEIDKILYDSSRFDLSRFEEGELEILSSEIQKMTVRLREQADALSKDKRYLADSLADISHQIRTPLTSISLIIEFLADSELTYEQRAKYVRELRELLDRIDWLINTLLKISKFDAGTVNFELKEVKICDVIKRAYEPISIPMDIRQQNFTVSVSDTDTLCCDESWLCEAVCNILKNCMEHTPDGGTLTVDCSKNRLFSEIAISDTGNGISKEDLPNIFKRFYKGHDSADSSVGIGLALARMIITKHNGTIKAENRKEGGARFVIRFYESVV